MAELIKEPYELSIWERKPSGEKFLMTIGSDSMTSPYKANNPIVRTNVNGEKVLSFTLYTKFFDNEIGEFVKNPFIDYLHNEVLLKLHRGLIPDKGWSEFIVKDIQENSETKTYTYTAKSAWALELGKTGYGLNFNSELMNNTGTALSLTKEIFKGTDWEVSMGENVKFWGSKIEPVYTATLTNLDSVTCIRQANIGDYNLYFSSVQSDVKIPGKTETETVYTAYIPYSSYQNYKETGELQFLWSPDNLYETDTNGLIYTANSYITTSFEINDTPKVDIAKKGEYLQNRNKTIYLKNIDRVVTEGTIGNKEAYHLVETSYLTNDTVQELIVNGRDFESTSGWRAIETGTSIGLDYENLELENIVSTNYNAKLIFKNDSDSSKYIYNAAIRSNATILGGNYSDPKGIAAGDQFVLESDQNLTIIFAKYETQTKEGVTSVNFINKVFETTITGGTTNIVSCSYGISYSDLLDGDYGLFIEVPTTDLSISYLSFYKYIPKSNNKPVTPYDIPEASIINEEIYILKDDINDSITSLKDIVPYKLKTGETFQSNNYGMEYEKISSINISKSNRFNALQEVCEAFECWADLVVEHEANGTIKKKRVILKNFIGDNKDIGFSYGLNLKSINRQLVSDQIVTKLIVEQNNNENGKNGFCTIVRARDNKSKLNSIYDFSYYINQGILSQEDIEADFYDENGLISQIGKQNKNILILNEELAKLETAKFSCEKDFSAAKEIKEAAELEIERLQQNYKDRTNKIYNGNFEELDDKQKTDSVIKEIVYCIKTQNKLLEKQTKIYNDNSSKLSDYQDEITEAKELIENHLLVLQDLINQFENKYASFIQEGTWSDESYFDDDLYYYDAQNVLYTSTFPKVTYTINVIDISVLSEQFTAFKFNIGDKTYIEDIEYFGWDQSNTKPYREEVVVSQLEEYLDSPENNKITVQNYKTQFEDLFQRIAATTQSLQYSAGAYQRAANKITSENEIDLTTLQNSLMAGLLNIQNMGNLSISWTEKGMIISSTDSSLSHKKMRLSNTGLDLSTDGGLTWRNAITGSGILADEVTSGTINANKVTIKSGEASTFIWDAKGLRAYETKWKNNILQSVDFNNYIEFNDNGLIAYKNDGTNPFKLTSDGQLELTGKITANEGYIGGWIIDSGILKNSLTNPTLWLAPGGEQGTINNVKGDFVFYANGNFGVDIDGKLYAISGKIGGWTIGATQLSCGNETGDGLILNAGESKICSKQYVNSTGSNGWMINNEGAVFNNITLRGALKCAVLEYAEVQAVGGIMMIRPATTIKDYEITPEGEAQSYTLVLTVENNELFAAGDWCKLTTEANGDVVKTDNKRKEILYSGINVNLFQLDDVIEETNDGQVVKKLKFIITSNDKKALADKALVGMGIVDLGTVGSIGLGLNSSTNSAMIPQTSFSVFSLKQNSDSNWKYLQPHIILGKIPENEEEIYGNLSGKYGLYADSVHLTGTIYANDGEIGGWTIDTTILKNGDSVWLAPKGKAITEDIPVTGANVNTSMVFKAGSNFGVDTDGNLYASGAKITGEINATSLKIVTDTASRGLMVSDLSDSGTLATAESLKTTNANVTDAKNKADDAYSLAGQANSLASDAAKGAGDAMEDAAEAATKATNYLRFDDGVGLIVGNLLEKDSSGKTTLTYNVCIDSDSLDIRYGNNIISSFDEEGFSLLNGAATLYCTDMGNGTGGYRGTLTIQSDSLALISSDIITLWPNGGRTLIDLKGKVTVSNQIAISVDNNKKMVYGQCTDQSDGTSFVGALFNNNATSYPYTEGLAIGGTSGNLLWKGNIVATTDMIPSIKAGSNVTISINSNTNEVTINAKDTTYNMVSKSANGLMYASDKDKLDHIAEYANNYSLPTASSSTLGGVKIGNYISNNGGTISLTKENIVGALGYTPPTTNTTYDVATTSANGLMSAADKTKLNGFSSASEYLLKTGGTINGYLTLGTGCMLTLGKNTPLRGTWVKDSINTERIILSVSEAGNINLGYISDPPPITFIRSAGCSVRLDQNGFGPETSKSYSLGSSSRLWTEVFATKGTINTSDEREKENIVFLNNNQSLLRTIPTVDIYSDFFDKIAPAQYNFIGENKVSFGLIAQQIVQVLNDLGMSEEELDLINHGFWVDEETGKQKDRYGLRYDNFIPLLIHEVQKLKKRIIALEEV